MTLRDEFIKSLESSSKVDLLFQGRNENYIKWLEEKVKKLTTSSNSDFAKCSGAICSLDMLDGVINKKGVIESILRKHFA